MKFEISKKWCIEKAQVEEGDEIGAGVIGIDPLFEGDEGRVEILDESRIALGRFVQLKRRKEELTIEQLAERADIEISELLNIEHDASYEPEPRTVYQLAVTFKVDQSKLMVLSGLTRPKDVTFVEDALRYAARSESLEALSGEEQAALDGLIAVLSEK